MRSAGRAEPVRRRRTTAPHSARSRQTSAAIPRSWTSSSARSRRCRRRTSQLRHSPSYGRRERANGAAPRRVGARRRRAGAGSDSIERSRSPGRGAKARHAPAAHLDGPELDRGCGDHRERRSVSGRRSTTRSSGTGTICGRDADPGQRAVSRRLGTADRATPRRAEQTMRVRIARDELRRSANHSGDQRAEAETTDLASGCDALLARSATAPTPRRARAPSSSASPDRGSQTGPPCDSGEAAHDRHGGPSRRSRGRGLAPRGGDR